MESIHEPADLDETDALEGESDAGTGSVVVVGLDGEMSSADIDSGGKLIQAGVAAWSELGELDVFSSILRQDNMEWSARAAQVHGLSREQVAQAPPAEEVDAALFEFLVAHGAVPGRRVVIACGFNVGVFDLPFFRQALPQSSSLLSRRSLDLNAALFALQGWDPHPGTQGKDFPAWKRALRREANRRLSSLMEVHEHDAGFDAAQALVGLEWLRKQLADPVTRLEAARTRLARSDMLYRELGEGLLSRLDGVSEDELRVLVGRFAPGGVRKWFGRFSEDLGSTPLQAVQAGRWAEVFLLATVVP